MKNITRAVKGVCIILLIVVVFTSHNNGYASVIAAIVILLLMFVLYPIIERRYLRNKRTVYGIVTEIDNGVSGNLIATIKFEFENIEYTIYGSFTQDDEVQVGSRQLILVNVDEPAESSLAGSNPGNHILLDIVWIIIIGTIWFIAAYTRSKVR